MTVKPEERTQYDIRYSQRPFELRVPGDALKDRAILRTIRKTGHPNKRLLDLGCGMGHTSTLLSSVAEVVGLDFSQEALKVALEKAKGSFACGDASTLPFRDNTFDYVIAKDLLEHIPDDGQVLSEIFRVCKDKAQVMLYLPCDLSGFNLSAESLVKKLTGYTLDADVGHLRRYTPDRAKRLLQARGFQLLRTWYFVHFSLGVASLLSVKGYRVLSKGKGKDKKLLSGLPLALVKMVFWIFELIGQVEAFFLKSLPGAGFFVQARVDKSAL